MGPAHGDPIQRTKTQARVGPARCEKSCGTTVWKNKPDGNVIFWWTSALMADPSYGPIFTFPSPAERQDQGKGPGERQSSRAWLRDRDNLNRINYWVRLDPSTTGAGLIHQVEFELYILVVPGRGIGKGRRIDQLPLNGARQDRREVDGDVRAKKVVGYGVIEAAKALTIAEPGGLRLASKEGVAIVETIGCGGHTYPRTSTNEKLKEVRRPAPHYWRAVEMERDNRLLSRVDGVVGHSVARAGQ